MTTGEPVRVFETRHTNAVNAVVFSPDGTQALSASADQTVILWDVATGTGDHGPARPPGTRDQRRVQPGWTVGRFGIV